MARYIIILLFIYFEAMRIWNFLSCSFIPGLKALLHAILVVAIFSLQNDTANFCHTFDWVFGLVS